MATNQIDKVTVGNYTETVNANGEITVSGVIGGKQFVQQIGGVRPPFALFYDPSNENLYMSPLEIQPGWQLIKIITSVTPDVQAQGQGA